MKVKKKNFSENEIDGFVIAQADDESAWAKIDYFNERAKRGSREKFLKALSNVPKVEPDEKDTIE